jgi:hypothetical protein
MISALFDSTFDTQGIEAFCRTVIAVTAVVGLIVRFVLLPYLKEHLVRPVSEVREQVKNTHETNLREDLDDIGKTMDRVRDEQALVRAELQRARSEDRQWRREHLAYSDSIANRLERVELKLKIDDEN